MKLESTHTKHYYIGSQRVSSALGTTFRLGFFPNQANNFFSDLTALEDFRDVANAKVHTATAALSATYSAMNQSIALPNPAVEGSLDLNTLPFENNLYDAYFYHSDHLGSSNYISNNTGIVSQHTEYLPFGETFVDEHLNSHNTPFKFNAKEFDDETGNYYYGARYYNPKWSTWLSVDPLAEEAPDWTPYRYGFHNPLRFIDPTGLSEYSYDEKGNLVLQKATKDKFDMLYSLKDYNGKKENGIKIEDTGILSGLLKERNNINVEHHSDKNLNLTGIYTTTYNRKEATKVFEFFSQNSDVEWTIQGNKTKDGVLISLGRLTGGFKNGIWNTSTDQALEFTGSIINGITENNLVFHYHNHSGTTNDDLNPSRNDINFAKKKLKGSPNADISIYMPRMSKNNYNAIRPHGRPPINYEPSKYLRLTKNYLKFF